MKSDIGMMSVNVYMCRTHVKAYSLRHRSGQACASDVGYQLTTITTGAQTHNAREKDKRGTSVFWSQWLESLVSKLESYIYFNMFHEICFMSLFCCHRQVYSYMFEADCCEKVTE